MNQCDNELYINKLFHTIIVGGGIALIAEKEKPIGMILGVIDNNVWDPNITMLRELVYWVEPEHRGGTAGYRLLKAYNASAQKLIDNKRIQLYTMTKMTNSPDIDFSRFGYSKTEETWVAGV
jgi:hypothetical protein